MRLSEAKRDQYRKKAVAQGYRSRAAYKLIQLDDKHHFLRSGVSVVDFGCAPGGWLQVASERVGAKGRVIGVDIAETKPVASNVRILRCDVLNPTTSSTTAGLLQLKADVVLSDLAPNISGVWELDHLKQIELTSKVIAMMPEILKPGGLAIVKVFDGENLKEILKTLKSIFTKVTIAKPPASRSQSSELYLICFGYIQPLHRNESGTR